MIQQVKEITNLNKKKDTAGADEFKRIRRISYPDADLFILCYSLNDRQSFDDLDDWYTEVHHENPKGKIVLCGTKQDLGQNGITDGEITQKANQLRAELSIKTSAQTREGVGELFLQSAQLCRQRGGNNQKRCPLL